MNLQCRSELCQLGHSELGSIYLVKVIFGKYPSYFDTNHVADSLQLQFYFDANHVPVREKVNRDIRSSPTKFAGVSHGPVLTLITYANAFVAGGVVVAAAIDRAVSSCPSLVTPAPVVFGARTKPMDAVLIAPVGNDKRDT